MQTTIYACGLHRLGSKIALQSATLQTVSTIYIGVIGLLAGKPPWFCEMATFLMNARVGAETGSRLT